MRHYEGKTKEELLKIIEQLEEKIDFLSSHLSPPSQERFRDKYSTRILDALPDMLTVFDHDANIIELASSPATNHVEGINASNITTTNVKDILPEEAYESVRKNMDKVILTGESSTARHDLMLDGVLHHYEIRIQSTISERYADDAWQKYGANNGTASWDKYYIADKSGSGSPKALYNEILQLAEVPELSQKGEFGAYVTEDGKTAVLIYQDGKGEVGIYFGDTSEYIAYHESDFSNFDSYFNAIRGKVFYTKYYWDNNSKKAPPLRTNWYSEKAYSGMSRL